MPHVSSARPPRTSTRAPGRAGRLALACALLLTPAAFVHAQVSPESLTFEMAVRRALEANPALLVARLRHPIDLAGISVAREHPNPEASVEIEKETPKQAFGLAVPIELGGKRARRIAVSEATLSIGDAELAGAEAQVRNDVRRTYFEALVAGERLAVMRDLRDVAARARDAAQARFDAGDAPRLEVLQAALAVDTAENDVSIAAGDATAARARLNALLGDPVDRPLLLTTTIDADQPVAATAVLDTARRQSVELRVLDRRIEEQRARAELARALRVPDLVPAATLTHDAEPEFTYGWRAGLTVTVPLFTTHKAGVLVEDATLTQLGAQRQATERRIEADVAAAAATAEAQRLAYVRYRDVILPRAQQVETMAHDSYRLGQTGIAALLQALQAARDVRLRSLETAAAFESALADLERAAGTPLP